MVYAQFMPPQFRSNNLDPNILWISSLIRVQEAGEVHTLRGVPPVIEIGARPLDVRTIGFAKHLPHGKSNFKNSHSKYHGIYHPHGHFPWYFGGFLFPSVRQMGPATSQLQFNRLVALQLLAGSVLAANGRVTRCYGRFCLLCLCSLAPKLDGGHDAMAQKTSGATEQWPRL